MDLVSSVVVYILLWWWIFLMALPFGSKPSENPIKGHANSAPAKPDIFKKVAAATVVSAVFFVIVKITIESGIFSFR